MRPGHSHEGQADPARRHGGGAGEAQLLLGRAARGLWAREGRGRGLLVAGGLAAALVVCVCVSAGSGGRYAVLAEAGGGKEGSQFDFSVDASNNVYMKNRQTGMTTVVDQSGKVVHTDAISEVPPDQGSKDVSIRGDTVSVRDPQTGITTVVDTASGSVRHEAAKERRTHQMSLRQQAEDAEKGVLAPDDVPRGEPHSYWMEWAPFAKDAKKRGQGGGPDVERESPDAAAFRRHFKAFKKYIGLDGVRPEEDAMRIFKIYPSIAGRPDLYPADDNPAPQDPIDPHPFDR